MNKGACAGELGFLMAEKLVVVVRLMAPVDYRRPMEKRRGEAARDEEDDGDGGLR